MAGSTEPQLDNSKLPTIGWREWVALPDLDLGRIKAKVDSGARSSSLHAFDIVEYEQDGQPWVEFKVHPIQLSDRRIVTARSPVADSRMIRSSNGTAERRYVIQTALKLLGQEWKVDLTLTDRNQMRFRMLLGREAFRGRFLLDAGKSYYGGKPKKKRRPKQ